jgi:hypothetical protein
MNEADRKWLEEHGIEVFEIEGERQQGFSPTFSMLDPKQDRGRPKPFTGDEGEYMNPDGAF